MSSPSKMEAKFSLPLYGIIVFANKQNCLTKSKIRGSSRSQRIVGNGVSSSEQKSRIFFKINLCFNSKSMVSSLIFTIDLKCQSFSNIRVILQTNYLEINHDLSYSIQSKDFLFRHHCDLLRFFVFFL